MWARDLPCTVTSSPRVSHTRPDLPAPHPTATGHWRPPITPASFVHSELRAPGPVTSQIAGTPPALISFLGTPQPISGPPPPLSSAPVVCAPCPKACFPQPADPPTEWSCLLAAISPRTVLPSRQVPFESLRTPGSGRDVHCVRPRGSRSPTAGPALCPPLPVPQPCVWWWAGRVSFSKQLRRPGWGPGPRCEPTGQQPGPRSRSNAGTR